MSRLNARLGDWDAVAKQSRWPALLVGNGMSMNVWSGFDYRRLYSVANLSTEAESIFTAIGTKNFEAVLEGLWQTRTVLDALGRRTSTIDRHYLEVREALLDAVTHVHPLPSQVPTAITRRIATTLDSYQSVYTLNYDLLPYWSLMEHRDDVRIADFFWSDGSTFDPDRTDLHAGWTGLFYLHGAVHLWHDVGTGTSGKWRSSSGGLLRGLAAKLSSAPERQPLFVSEGTARHKRRTIRRSEYLSFAIQTLREEAEPLAIFGTSLGLPDAHVVSAINVHPQRPLAIAVRPGTAEQIRRSKARWHVAFPEQRLTFFMAETHPLGDPTLSVSP